MARKIAVTSALPYANGPIHMGHLVEYIQTDIWVRFQELCGNKCFYFCADDTHGTAIMIRARKEGITPEQLISRVHAEHLRDFRAFNIEFDNYYTTHSEENRRFSEEIYSKLAARGSITQREVEQAFCESCGMFLPDRFIKGTCPRCKTSDQYGDSCDSCGGTHHPTELIEPKCASCGAAPVRKRSVHYFFRLADYEKELRELLEKGYAQQSVMNKLDEWFRTGLKDWDISRDGPYFGFKIPGEEDKYFYVWLDAPIGYMASAKNYCDNNGLDFNEVWNSKDWELYHFIGKDIMYFHALFWPAMLTGAGFKVANKLFVHGFLTVNGEKMSKSRGTFIMAETYLKHLDPEWLRYYYATKLSGGVEDIDLNLADFVSRVNSDLVGKLANLASRSGPMLTDKLGGVTGRLDDDGRAMVQAVQAAKDGVTSDYENLNYAGAIRRITAAADVANKYFDDKQPWKTIKTDPEATRRTLTAILSAVRILTVYLKPVLPAYAAKIEKFLNIPPLSIADADSTLEEHTINRFERLTERIDPAKVEAMVDESRERDAARPVPQLDEPLAAECTIEDFKKVDLRVARVVSAAAVPGADKLLQIKLDIGGIEKTVFAGIAMAYKPEQLAGRLVICCANLKPRQMKFGLSEGMILAAGAGGQHIFVLGIDDGARPGQRVH